MVAPGRSRTPGPVDPLAVSPFPTSLTHWWLADDLAAVGDGNAVSSWTDRISGVAVANTSTARPLYRATGLGSQPSVEFDGSNDSLVYSASDPVATTNVGAVIAVVTFGATTGSVWSSGDDAVSTRYMFGNLTSSRLRMQAAQNASADVVSFSQSTGTGIFEWQANGIWELRKNNAVQAFTVDGGANVGRWFGGVTGRDRFSLGSLASNNTQNNYLTGHIASLMILNAPLTDPQRAPLYGYLSDKYSIAI